jgi:hypothetical protein
MPGRGTDDSFPVADSERRSSEHLLDVAGPRHAQVAFGVVEVVAVPLLLYWGRKGWFGGDDWDFFVSRKAGDLGDLMRPHNVHWVTIPVLLYRGAWALVGLRSYVVYLVPVVVAHLAIALMLRTVMRRCGCSPWIATFTAGSFVFFGAARGDIVVAFQITLLGSVAFGLAQLLLADHVGPLNRWDVLGVAAGLAALMCSGVGVTMAIVVGLATLLRRGWRVAMFHAAPLGFAYVVWTRAAPKAGFQAQIKTNTGLVGKFVLVGFEETFGRLGHVPGVGALIAITLATGIVLIARHDSVHGLRMRYATPAALLVGAAAFLIIAGLGRSGVWVLPNGETFSGSIDHLNFGRYFYVVTALMLPAIALSADAIIRRWSNLKVAVIAVLLVGVPGNLMQFAKFDAGPLAAPVRRMILETPRLPFSEPLPRSFRPQPVIAALVTVGWLRDALRSGRLPETDPHLTRVQTANMMLNLAVQPAPTPLRHGCELLTNPTVRVFNKGDVLGVTRGSATIVLLDRAGRSRPRDLRRGGTWTVIAGPLRLRLRPGGDEVKRSTVVCVDNRGT